MRESSGHPGRRGRRNDRVRELMLGVLMTADMNKLALDTALQRVAEGFVAAPQEAPTSSRGRKPQVEPMTLGLPDDAFLPVQEEWTQVLDRLLAYVQALMEHGETLDLEIRKASPRWRLERMTVLDRSLLRLGAVELVAMSSYRPRQTFNGVIELAKRYGSDNSPRFVNGILDQIRKNLDIPFE